MFDAYVNGMKVAGNYQYRNNATANTGMINIGSSSTVSKVVCWFDDIKVYERFLCHGRRIELVVMLVIAGLLAWILLR